MNISISEWLLVLLVALLVIKPEQWPHVALKLGKIIRHGRNTLNKFKHELGGLTDAVEQQAHESKREKT